ncbi:MAG: HEPN domain-containing protein [Beijerinckiaceae bacterium]|nr:HEPN domain-containing protein [Beijerinckiaceae bacterium]
MASNLYRDFHADKIDPNELEFFLMSQFSSTYGRPSNNKWGIFDNDNNTLFEIDYNKSGAIKSITAGNCVSKEKIKEISRKITNEFIENSNYCVSRNIVFTRVPFIGFTKIHDTLQIIEIEEDAPKAISSIITFEHPLVIEFLHKKFENPHLNASSLLNKKSRIINFLNAMIIEHIFENEYSGLTWVTHEDLKEKSRQGYKYYLFNNFKASSELFTNLENKRHAQFVDHLDYYQSNAGIMVSEPLKIPNNLSYNYSLYLNMDKNQRNKFDNAAYWFYKACRNFSSSKSLAILSLSSTIEALKNDFTEHAKCDHCGAISGATKNFKRTFEILAPGIEPRTLNSFYEARSQLTHGNRISFSEESLFLNGHLQRFEDQMVRNWFYAARIALVNYLIPAVRAKLIEN